MADNRNLDRDLSTAYSIGSLWSGRVPLLGRKRGGRENKRKGKKKKREKRKKMKFRKGKGKDENKEKTVQEKRKKG